MQGVCEKLCIRRFESEKQKDGMESFKRVFWNEKYTSLHTESRPASVLMAVP